MDKIKNPGKELVGGSNVAQKLLFIMFKGTVAIIVFVIVYILYKSFSMYKSTKANASKIRSDWPKYRCKPHIIPIAGLIGPKGTSTVSNAVECGTTFFKNSFLKFMSPFINFFEMVLKVIADLVSSVQNIRKMIHYLRESIKSFIKDIGGLVYGYAKKLSYLFNRLLDTFSKIFRVFQDLYYALGYSIYTVLALWNSPVGGVARYFCFEKKTMVDMKDGTKKQIYNVKPGDEIKKGGRVLATHKFTGKGTDMYLYKNKVVVSGSHLVFEDNKWIRIENSTFAEEVDEKNTIYCLSTENGKIYVDNILFADYIETETKEHISHILDLIIKYLTNKTSKHLNEKVWGFKHNTLFKLATRKYKNISKLKIGDVLQNGDKIEGITKIYGNNIQLYNYNNCICSGNNIVKVKDTWDFVCNISKPIFEKEQILYNIFTTSGEISINENIYRDYEQVKDKCLNDNIDNYIENQLNKNVFYTNTDKQIYIKRN